MARRSQSAKAAADAVAEINSALQALVRRAERNKPETLKETFVSVGGIEHALMNRDNKIIFGRRGTGKTHALHYIVEQKIGEGQIAVYIDLRQLGSDTSLYADDRISSSQRTARLLRDFIQTLHDGVIECCSRDRDQSTLADAGDALNALANSVATIEVDGEAEIETEYAQKRSSGKTRNTSVALTQKPALELSSANKRESETTISERLVRRGTPKLTIRFGNVSEALKTLVRQTNRELWICIDEWTAIPEALQPLLADMLRRVFFPISQITVQIGAIEHRSSFYHSDGKGYLGIELSADAQASVNLDDFMVFESNAEKAKQFFSELIYRHYRAEREERGKSYPVSSADFIKSAFASKKVFDEFVRAAEGVPRDAICLLSTAAQRAQSKRISVPIIRSAARDWFQQDKSNFLRDNKEADFFLRWIIDEVIGKRRSRAFLVQSSHSNSLLDALFDHRLLHLLKRSIASHDEPGVRYAAFKLDYGCYVELISTKRSPKGLLPTGADDETNILMFHLTITGQSEELF
jgi:hypothetical protein